MIATRAEFAWIVPVPGRPQMSMTLVAHGLPGFRGFAGVEQVYTPVCIAGLRVVAVSEAVAPRCYALTLIHRCK